MQSNVWRTILKDWRWTLRCDLLIVRHLTAEDTAPLMSKKTTPEKSFGELEASLQSLVGKLESTDLSLEDAISAYEEACSTVKLAQERLDAAQQKVRILNEDHDDAENQDGLPLA